MNINRRKFVKSGALLIPTLASNISYGQPLTLSDGGFLSRTISENVSTTSTFGEEIQRGAITSFTTTTEVITLSGTISVGKRAVLMFQHYLGTATVASVADSKGNTWTVDFSFLHTTNHRHTYISSDIIAALVPGDTITVTFSESNTSYRTWILLYLNGIFATNMVDSYASNATYGTSVTVSAETTASNTQIVGILESTGVTTSTYAGSSFDAIGSSHEWTAPNESWYLQKTQTSSGAKNPGGSWNANATWGGSWVAYKTTNYYATTFETTTPDYLLKSTDPGFTDSKLGIFSMWIKCNSGDGTNMRVLAKANLDFLIVRTSANTFRIVTYNGDATTLALQMTSTATLTADGNWHHVLMSWDTSNNTNCWIAIDGTQGTTINTRNDVTCDYTFTGWYCSMDASGLNADVSEIYFAPGQSLGAFSSANVEKFRTTGAKPANLGSNGSAPTGVQPGIYFKNPYSSFGVNSGTGGNFTVNGTLADATIP